MVFRSTFLMSPFFMPTGLLPVTVAYGLSPIIYEALSSLLPPNPYGHERLLPRRQKGRCCRVSLWLSSRFCIRWFCIRMRLFCICTSTSPFFAPKRFGTNQKIMVIFGQQAKKSPYHKRGCFLAPSLKSLSHQNHHGFGATSKGFSL